MYLDSGTVDFEEFISMMSACRQIKSINELDDELKEIFNVTQLTRIHLFFHDFFTQLLLTFSIRFSTKTKMALLKKAT